METVLLCIEVFFARLLDVSIGSVRTIYLVKQKNLIACILAFIEILIWFLVAKEILTNKDASLVVILSYSGGYAVGTYLGGLINKYLVKGSLTAMVITSKDKDNIISALKSANYGVSIINLENDKTMLLVELNKKNMGKFKNLITSIDRKAFIIVNESLHVENGYVI